MPPIQDPRFSKARWNETLQEQREATERTGRMEYIKPLVMLVIGGGVVMALLTFAGSGDPDELSGPAAALLYPVRLVFALFFGVAGLWLAAKLWLGGVGPLGLAILRLAGIYAATDLIPIIAAPLQFLGWFVYLVCYVGLLAWLFDLEAIESMMLALITFVLKILASFTILSLLGGVF